MQVKREDPLAGFLTRRDGSGRLHRRTVYITAAM
jgi:hypothetical protein